jgi:hypothetical protein
MASRRLVLPIPLNPRNEVQSLRKLNGLEFVVPEIGELDLLKVHGAKVAFCSLLRPHMTKIPQCCSNFGIFNSKGFSIFLKINWFAQQPTDGEIANSLGMHHVRFVGKIVGVNNSIEPIPFFEKNGLRSVGFLNPSINTCQSIQVDNNGSCFIARLCPNESVYLSAVFFKTDG